MQRHALDPSVMAGAFWIRWMSLFLLFLHHSGRTYEGNPHKWANHEDSDAESVKKNDNCIFILLTSLWFLEAPYAGWIPG